MSLQESILALLEVAYEQTTDDLVHTILARDVGDPPTAQQIVNAIAALEKDRWIYSPERKPGHSATWRRRTVAQREALLAENNPHQGKLL